ncbi:MAG: SGNH/GDSL hydrolase family protein, partial [Peptostreptococcales bacterium]
MRIWKVLFQIATVCLFVNPITLYLLIGHLLLSLVIPFGLVLITLSISRHPFLSRIQLYFFNLVVIIGIFYHAELIFRMSFPERDIPNLYEIRGKYYFNKPYLHENFNDEEYFSTYITNRQGFRISEKENPDDTIDECDWLFLGDSFTQGAQVNYTDLYTTKTYQYFPDKIILNAGISGYSIVDALNYYISEGHKLKPSKVFLQVCIFNDFMKVKENRIGVMEYMIQYSSLYHYLFYNTQYINPADLPLGRWTEPFYLTEEKNKDYNIFYKKTSVQKEEDIRLLIYYLSEFKKETTKNNSDLCILLIPTKEQISYKYYKEVIDSFDIKETDLDMHYPNRLIDSLSHTLNFELIDLYDPFRKNEFFPFFRDDEHLNNYGHRIIAESIAQTYEKGANAYRYLTTGNNRDRY